MQDFWLSDSEIEEVSGMMQSLSETYNKYISYLSDEIVGAELEELADNYSLDNTRIDGIVSSLFSFPRAFDKSQKVGSKVMKHLKTGSFLNFFDYTVKVDNLVNTFGKISFIPQSNINGFKNMFLKSSVSYITDYLMKTTIEEFRLKDGSINDGFIDIILNNIVSLTKQSYGTFPDAYNEIISKVIPGDFISSLLTFEEDKSEVEKVVDMLIHLSTSHLNELTQPLSDDPFFSILSILNPLQKKEKTIVETLGEAIKSVDVSGITKVKAAGIVLNRASNMYEKQKKSAYSFLIGLADSIPDTSSFMAELFKEKEDPKKKTKIAKQPIEKNKSKLNKNPDASKETAQAKKEIDEEVIDNIKSKEVKDEKTLLGNVADYILEGGWANFDLLEKEFSKFWQ